MARIAKFTPVKTPKGWRVSIPQNLSNTGSRQRRFFEKKTEAEGFIARLKLRCEVHGTGACLLTPAQEEQAAAAFRLLSSAGLSTTPLSEVVGQHLAKIEKSKASKPWAPFYWTNSRFAARRIFPGQRAAAPPRRRTS